MKLVILDAYSVFQEDIALPEIPGVEIEYHGRTSREQVIERIGDAELIFTSKCRIDGEVMDACPNLKYIGEMATGYDNLDAAAAEERGIAVTNCPNYSTAIVAQHTMALILEIAGKVGAFNAAVQKGDWQRSKDFCLTSETMISLEGKTLGIIGYGNIGKRVGAIAEALGMKVLVRSLHGDEVFDSDIISLHLPLTPETEGMVNEEFIAAMKEGSILINTSRGGLVHEEALARALSSGKLAAAGLDVLREEPPKNGSPLIGLSNCYITPHVAWMAKEIRERIVSLCRDNLIGFLDGREVNRIV